MNRTTLAYLALALSQFLPSAGAQTYTITTIAGNNSSGFSGDSGPATGAQLNGPHDLVVTAGGALYIADSTNQRIRVVQNGNITTAAGNGVLGFADGAATTSAEFSSPQGLALDSSGNLFVADVLNHVVRKLSGSTISTVAGSAVGVPNNYGANGNGGLAINAQLNSPGGVAVDGSGNIFIADSGNNRIQRVDAATGIVTTVAGTGVAGFFGDGLLAKSAQLKLPLGIAVDTAGNLYITDTFNNRVRKVTAGTNIITTIAGSTTGFGGDFGPASIAKLNHPTAIAIDSARNIYIADSLNNRIRMVNPSGIIQTIAGNGISSYRGDTGPATQASIASPTGVAVDKNGNVYIADTQNNVIRLLTAPANAGNAPSISGAASAGDFGAFSAVAPGGWMEIYGSNMAPPNVARLWTSDDFSGIKAPTALDFTSAYIGGQAAFVDYISPNQVNVQVPSTVSLGPQPLVLSTATGIAGPFTVTVNTVQPGLLAPPKFSVNGKQYVVAQFSDGTFVLPVNAIPGVPSRPARAGEVITIYGVGFGTVTPTIPAGQIVQSGNALTGSLQFLFGQTPAALPLPYAGLAPGTVGEYQFNVTVPAVPAGDLVPLTFTLNGTTATQTLYTAVQ
jgi:uncharacterized protein (TIGR03437 family)